MRRTVEDPGPVSSGCKEKEPASIGPERRGAEPGSIAPVAMHGPSSGRGRVIAETDSGNWFSFSSTSRWIPKGLYSPTSASDKGRITQIVRTMVLERSCLPFMASSDSPLAADPGGANICKQATVIYIIKPLTTCQEQSPVDCQTGYRKLEGGFVKYNDVLIISSLSAGSCREKYLQSSLP